MMDEAAEKYNDSLRMLRHDINNQLSNIHLCLDQLNYEVPDPSPDFTFYVTTIMASCKKIEELLKSE
ncbi:hypothetical protein GCM10023149_44300 [Mucilaginibacter gynuensis]|uniref:Histidine kinase n=1 Tax=Mucilaginibacter gynuensis TaxID=1302236 RepID=A0ABP8H965_9SPHI